MARVRLAVVQDAAATIEILSNILRPRLPLSMRSLALQTKKLKFWQFLMIIHSL